MAAFIEAFLPAFFYVFIIVDPLASMPFFLSLTSNHTQQEMRIAATKAVIIAGILALIFIFSGQALLDLMHITVKDFKIAGGLVLMLLGLESVLGFTLSKGKENKSNELEAVAVLVATPLLTGPGLMTALLVLTQEQGIMIALSATLAALLISWIVLYNSTRLTRILGNQIVEVGSKVLGLFVLALGVSFIRDGLGLLV